MRALKHLGVFLLWSLAASLAVLALAPALAVAAVVALSAWLLWAYFLRPDRIRRRALIRLRPLRGEPLRWTLIAAPALLVLSWALGEVYVKLVPVPTEALNPFDALLDRPGGRLSLTVLAVGIAPVLEEFFFRGLIQRSLERRHGARWGIGIGAALFAAVHVLPWVFPLHFFLGVAFGFAVYATRSIWAGVVLHAVNNVSAMAALLLQEEEPSPVPTLWEVGLTADWWSRVALLAGALLLAGWVARRLWEAGRAARLRYA